MRRLAVKRYVRKGVPNEHRALIWMAASGAQQHLELNQGYYQSLLKSGHDHRLEETIRTGQSHPCFIMLHVVSKCHIFIVLTELLQNSAENRPFEQLGLEFDGFNYKWELVAIKDHIQ